MTDFNRPDTSPKANDTGIVLDTDFAPATGTTGESTGADATDTAAGARHTLKDEAAKLSAKATDKARGLVDEGKARATSALDEFSKLMDDAAGSVDEKLGEQYGQYARSAAQAIAGFSDGLRGKEVEDLLADAREFVRKSPAIAIGTAAALGFVLARVVKAGVDTDPTTPATPTKG
ncbi:hypothetical protein [Sphingomonas hankookensis]|uniref:Nutrient deprivation-induced protein n=1 Tax=Sphingomonas hengshuiensis TaxID=1609977 RepID=A0A2W5B4C9_9SPHN|nr:MAG: hypothetical protein DI632_12020 [Sphingomonas hengshuiensis]